MVELNDILEARESIGGKLHRTPMLSSNALGKETGTELYFKAYVQWNDDKLLFGGREKIISNLLLRYIYKPGSDLYVVYNDGRLIGAGGGEITNRTLMAKVTFFWRK